MTTTEVLLMADRLIDNLRAENEDLRGLATSRGDAAATAQLIARQAIHALHREQKAHKQLQVRYTRLVQEYRDFRAATITRSERAA